MSTSKVSAGCWQMVVLKVCHGLVVLSISPQGPSAQFHLHSREAERPRGV